MEQNEYIPKTTRQTEPTDNGLDPAMDDLKNILSQIDLADENSAEAFRRLIDDIRQPSPDGLDDYPDLKKILEYVESGPMRMHPDTTAVPFREAMGRISLYTDFLTLTFAARGGYYKETVIALREEGPLPPAQE